MAAHMFACPKQIPCRKVRSIKILYGRVVPSSTGLPLLAQSAGVPIVRKPGNSNLVAPFPILVCFCLCM